MTTKMKTILAAAIVFGLPLSAFAECESGSTAVGAADGNAVETYCVNSEVAMVATEPVAAVSPTPAEEPNPNPNPASQGAEGNEGDNEGLIE